MSMASGDAVHEYLGPISRGCVDRLYTSYCGDYKQYSPHDENATGMRSQYGKRRELAKGDDGRLLNSRGNIRALLSEIAVGSSRPIAVLSNSRSTGASNLAHRPQHTRVTALVSLKPGSDLLSGKDWTVSIWCLSSCVAVSTARSRHVVPHNELPNPATDPLFSSQESDRCHTAH